VLGPLSLSLSAYVTAAFLKTAFKSNRELNVLCPMLPGAHK
jgi:hypothetical protein